MRHTVNVTSQRIPFHPSSALLASVLLFSGLISQDAKAQVHPVSATEEIQRQSPQTCQTLLTQLRWHQPFFGTRQWQEVAQETVSYAQPQCRQALANGQQPEIAHALQSLFNWSQTEGTALRRYVFRVTCQLRVQSLYDLILEGSHEPGVFVDCVDAVFALQRQEQDSVSLRQRYLDGLLQQPLTTPIPPSLLQGTDASQLAPVLLAYDRAKKPKRDSLFAALCLRSAQHPSAQHEVCRLQPAREPDWAKEALAQGQVTAALPYLATMSGAHLPDFLPILQRYDAQRLPGRDKLHHMICQQRVLADRQLLSACQGFSFDAEPRWLHQQKTDELNQARRAYYYTAMSMGISLGFLSMLLVGRAILINRRRALAELSPLALSVDHAVG